MGEWTLSETFELLRGALAVHTRSYQVKNRPLPRDSSFAMVFSLVAKLAATRELHGFAGTKGAPVALTAIGPRTPAEAALHRKLSARADRELKPDPPFVPPGLPQRVLLLSMQHFDRCLAFDAMGGRRPYEKPMLHHCSSAKKTLDERAVWLWTIVVADSEEIKDARGAPVLGYLRPSYTRTSQVFCLDSTSAGARYTWCKENRESQIWKLIGNTSHGWIDKSPVMIQNSATGFCLAPKVPIDDRYEKGMDVVVTADCSSGNELWELRDPKYTGQEASIIGHS